VAATAGGRLSRPGTRKSVGLRPPLHNLFAIEVLQATGHASENVDSIDADAEPGGTHL
jgi:hypothetical protein